MCLCDLRFCRICSGSLFLIAGPCVIESEDHAIRMAEIIKGVTRSLNLPFIFKASYDKANRTSLKSFRGPGLKEGLRILQKVKKEVKVPILTDVHEVSDVAAVAEVADILQIPAFLCRQTDLIVAAALTERVVNIKKGQFVSPWDMKHAVEKCHTSGNKRVFVTERGSSFGYNNLVVDMRSLAIMRKFAPVVFD
ncbi:MAG: 3-deoxy-8-phosphooctulonate synthase, partial [Acidobacteria bacterium]